MSSSNLSDNMLFVTIILDGVGIGAQPDAEDYGDVGSDTLGHVLCRETPFLPNLEALGLGCIRPLSGLKNVKEPGARFGKMMESSAGKDSTTGHWEIAGIHLETPFPTYPDGFPEEIIDAFCQVSGYDGILGNRPESGTVIIEEFGARHMSGGRPIIYTSADSVFQIAAHVDVISLDRLYELCRIAREKICVGSHNVGRVIARPFRGSPGDFSRISAKRKDFSRRPESLTLQEALQRGGVRTVSVGKVADLFGGVGFDESRKTGSNAVGIAKTRAAIREAVQSAHPTFIWTNLIDFDQEFGHRNNPGGFARSLEEFDRALPSLLEALPPGSRLVITADHGNDPTTATTDHSREYVPLLYYGSSGEASLGTRPTFADHAATVSQYFGIKYLCRGSSFEPSKSIFN